MLLTNAEGGNDRTRDNRPGQGEGAGSGASGAAGGGGGGGGRHRLIRQNAFDQS